MENNPTVEQVIRWLTKGKVNYEPITSNQKESLAVYWQLNIRSRK